MYYIKKIIKMKNILNKILQPKFILKGIIIFLILFLLFKAGDYGINWDSFTQDTFGKLILKWYASLGKNNEFTYFTNIRWYGPFIEEIIASIQFIVNVKLHLFTNEWLTRSYVSGFIGILGIYLVAQIYFEIKRPWMGVFSAIILAITPRYFGDIFYNTKDIPFAVSTVLLLYLFIKLIKNWNINYKKYSIFLGIAFGISTVIRVTSLIFLPVFCLVILIYLYSLFLNSEKKKLMINEIKKITLSAIIIFIPFVIIVPLTWPYVLMSPINHFIESVTIMAHYPKNQLNSLQLFNGKQYHPSELPLDYIPVWLLVSTPIITLLLFIYGTFNYVYITIKNKKYLQIEGIIFIYFFTILLSLIILKPSLYNGIRQVMFLLPPIAMISAYGLYNFIIYIKNNKMLYYFGISIIVLLYSLIIVQMFNLHPYEYVYFNQGVGGLKGASNKFDLDYYATCLKESSLWLNRNYSMYTTEKNPTYTSSGDLNQTLIYLNKNFIRSDNNPTFYIPVNVSPNGGNYLNDYKNYKVIYKVQRDNTIFCEVKVKNN